MNPDEIPAWLAIPTAITLWTVWLTPIIRRVFNRPSR